MSKSFDYNVFGEDSEEAKKFVKEKSLINNEKGSRILSAHMNEFKKIRLQKAQSMLGSQPVNINVPQGVRRLPIDSFLSVKIGKKDIVIKASTKELSMDEAYKKLKLNLEGWMLAHLANDIGDALGILVDGLGKSTDNRSNETQIFTSISKVEKLMDEIKKVDLLEKVNNTMVARVASEIWGKGIASYIVSERKYGSYFSGFVFHKEDLYKQILNQIKKTDIGEKTEGGCIRWSLMSKTMNPKETVSSEWVNGDSLVNCMINIIQEYTGQEVDEVDNIWEFVGQQYKKFKDEWLFINKVDTKRQVRSFKRTI